MNLFPLKNSYSSAISASTEIIHKLRLQTRQNNACCKTLIDDLTFRMPQHTGILRRLGKMQQDFFDLGKVNVFVRMAN